MITFAKKKSEATKQRLLCGERESFSLPVFGISWIPSCGLRRVSTFIYYYIHHRFFHSTTTAEGSMVDSLFCPTSRFEFP